MNYLKVIAIFLILNPWNVNCMEKKRSYTDEKEVEMEDATSKKNRSFWIDPHALRHGFYLYQIKNKAKEHFRISDTRIYMVRDATGLESFQVNPKEEIRPLEVTSGHVESEARYTDHLSHMEGTDVEVACLKLENLMKLDDIRYLWVFRTWLENKQNQMQCRIHAYTDDNRKNPFIEEPKVLPNHKVATRIIIKLLEDSAEDKTRFEVETHTISARIQQHEINRRERLHHS